jgi:hypothetical protein
MELIASNMRSKIIAKAGYGNHGNVYIYIATSIEMLAV